jgi:hypothetical protein
MLRRLCASELHICITHATTLPSLLYGCDTCSLTLREKCRYRVFENRVLRKICTPRREEVTEDGKKLYNSVLHYLYTFRFTFDYKTQ